MKVKRYVSDATIEALRMGRGIRNDIARNEGGDCTHEITIEIPDPPFECAVWVCDKKPEPSGPCNSPNNCFGDSKARYNCRKITVREVTE